MILPTIHLNGTSAQDLLERYAEAAKAVNAAMEALQRAAPHGRDYYPQNSDFGTDVFSVAQREYIERQAALNRVRDDLEKLAGHVQDALDAKAKQRAR